MFILKMKKRGQAGIFVIIGIVLVAVIFLIFFFRESLGKTIRESPTDSQEYLNQQLGDVKREIGRCAELETKAAAKLLMENAGVFERDFGYVVYSGIKYPILCRAMENGEGCLSENIFISDMQNKLDNYLPLKISNCINLNEFRDSDYELSSGNIGVSSLISDKNILITLDFPIELKKGAYSTSEDKFVYAADTPLGEFTNAVNRLVQKKSGGEEIDIISFGMLSKNRYRLELKKPYPDEIYDLSLSTNDEYHFYFAFEGIPREGLERTAVII